MRRIAAFLFVVATSCATASEGPTASVQLAATDPALWGSIASVTFSVYRAQSANCAALLAKTQTTAAITADLEASSTVNTSGGTGPFEALLDGVTDGAKVLYVVATSAAGGQGSKTAHACSAQTIERGKELSVTLSLTAY